MVAARAPGGALGNCPDRVVLPSGKTREPGGIPLSLSGLVFLRELLQQIVAVHEIVNPPLVDEIVAPGDLEKIVLLERA